MKYADNNIAELRKKIIETIDTLQEILDLADQVEDDKMADYNRPVAALTMDKDLICEYNSAAEAARCLKIRVSLIRKCLKGIYKSTNGLRFIYID